MSLTTLNAQAVDMVEIHGGICMLAATLSVWGWRKKRNHKAIRKPTQIGILLAHGFIYGTLLCLAAGTFWVLLFPK